MAKRSIRILIPLAAAAGAAAALAPAAPAAAAGVGPNQYFAGLVNMRTAAASIGVLCAGPASFGHPLPDQTVAVELLQPVTTDVGFTGLDATSIVAILSWPTPVAPPPPVKIATFTSYGTAAIPTDITVPCSGSGAVQFVPSPDDGGRAATVDVTFVNIGA